MTPQSTAQRPVVAADIVRSGEKYDAKSASRICRWNNLSTSVIVAIMAALVVGCSSGDELPEGEEPPTASGNTVELREVEFRPPNIEVGVGEEVTWVWNDGDVDHNVVGDDFASDVKSEGAFSETFEEPGTYDYVCTLHPGMEGTILVAED